LQVARERLNERLVDQESRELPREEIPDFWRRRLDLLLDSRATIDDGNDVLKVVSEKITSTAIGESLELGCQEASRGYEANTRTAGKLLALCLSDRCRIPAIAGTANIGRSGHDIHFRPFDLPTAEHCFVGDFPKTSIQQLGAKAVVEVFPHRDFHDEIDVLCRSGRSSAGLGYQETKGRSSEKDHPFGERVQPLGHETNRLRAIQ
jgi:hypothetical protein